MQVYPGLVVGEGRGVAWAINRPTKQTTNPASKQASKLSTNKSNKQAMYMHTYSHPSPSIHAFMHGDTYIYIYTYTCVYIYICTHVHVNIYIYVYRDVHALI